MSQTMTITDFIKTTPAAASLSGLSMLCANSSGVLSKTVASNFITVKNNNMEVMDLDTLKEPGLYLIKSGSLNVPTTNINGAFVLVLKVDNSNCYQLLFNRMTQSIYFRAYVTNTWYAWKEIAFVGA